MKNIIYDNTKILTETIKRLLRRDAVSHLKKIVNRRHAADIAGVFPALSVGNQRKLFKMIDDIEKKGAIFSELDDETFLELIKEMDLNHLVEIFENMAKDDLTDLIAKMPMDLSSSILDKMKNEGSEEVEGLLRYGDDTAGGIMDTDYIALKEDVTAKEAIKSLQKEHSDVEMPFYLYVVDDYDKLVGVSSLRQLVVNPPDRPLKEFMSTDVMAVQTYMDQEDVAKIVARYDILAVPVVNESRQLVGIVTVDDVIDILREEATEDILKMAGVGDEFVESKSVVRSTRIRLPWLFASCMGGIFAFYIIGHFEASLEKVAYLAAFIPVIMGMGGNIGTQSSTIVVRGLATGRIEISDIQRVVFKELMVGLVLGLTYGLIIGIVAQLKYGTIFLAVSVCLSVICSMSVAALVGSLVPMLFGKFNIDPAVASGPFVTTAIDIISVFFYFEIATRLLGL